MRQRWLTRGWIALGLAVAGFVSVSNADDAATKSSWTAKVWPWSSRKVPEGQRDASGRPADDNKAEVDKARRLRAELDWKRRAEVCQKLRQIAFETNDVELERFADRLDQRAWDSYVKHTGMSATSVTGDERVLAERIGIDFSLLEPAAANTDSNKKREERR